MILTALAMHDPNDPRSGLLALALALCLPAVLPALPALYGALALPWNLTRADSGGVTWPVTVWYVVVLGVTAMGNVWLIHTVVRHRRLAGDPQGHPTSRRRRS